MSMERFDGMLTSVDCTSQGLTLKFEDDATFAYAQTVWDWVNGKDNHTFLMIVGKGDCGDNPHRIPYLVSSIAYDEAANVAELKAKTGPWKELIHSYELQVGSVPMSDVPGLVRRDYTKDLAIDLSHNFGFKAKVQAGDRGVVSGELVCDPCQTSGKMKFEFVIKTKIFVPYNVKLRLSPEGVKARAAIKFDFMTNFNSKQKLNPKWKIAEIPLSGISIPPNILNLGPILEVQLGAEITPFETAFSVLAGATATLPDTALLQADMLDPSNNEFSSWIPTLDADEVKGQGSASVFLKSFLVPALKLQAEALGIVLSIE